MNIDILTLFPDMVSRALDESIIGRAQQAGHIAIRCHNIRDYTPDRHGRTDDYPYGGGQGMIMQCEPLYRCLSKAKGDERAHTVLLSPRGEVFTQHKAKELLGKGRLILICGHYEGVDQRFIDECVDEELSIGDFVLTGGELAAAVVADAICRMAPGVLSSEESFAEESHFSGLLEYPQYTRPEEWRGRTVPEVLLGGHHEQIRRWRRREALRLTAERRPDMLDQLKLSDEDEALLAAIPDGEKKRPGSRRLETPRLILRRFTPEDAVPANRNFYGDEELFRFLPEPVQTPEGTGQMLQNWQTKYRREDFYAWAVTLKDKEEGPIGSVVLTPGRTDPGCGELTFMLSRAWQHQGYAGEAVRAVLRYLFFQRGFRRVQAHHAVANSAPGGVMRRAGMLYEGMSRLGCQTSSGPADCHLYAAIRDDWAASREG